MNTPEFSHKSIAALGEKLAASRLAAGGLKLLRANWHSGRFAEIDLIMQANDGLFVFVEVKTRRGSIEELCSSMETISWRKRQKLIVSAQSFCARMRHADPRVRLDAFLIAYRQAVRDADKPCLHDVQYLHIPGAFDSV